jgi:phytoene dehydrogenase-like protein
LISIVSAGKHLLLAGTPLPDGLSSEIVEGVLDRIDEQMKTLYPGLEDHIIWKHRTNLEYGNLMGGRGAAEAIGLAQSVEQTGPFKPDPRMPVKGLYIVGCDAGGIGIGTEQAADSAINVADIIINET